jgi:multiple sugar transport system permease protein
MTTHNDHLRTWLIGIGLLVLVALYALTPLYWIATTSLKIPGTEFRLPVEYLPSNPTLESYQEIFGERVSIQTAVRNSLLVSSLVTVGVLLVASLAAYAITRLRFRYGITSLFLIQIGGMVPPIVVIAPTFVLMRSFDLVGSVWALIPPNIAYNIPLSTWLLAAYFAGLPRELEDAALVDGLRPAGVFWRIMLPLAGPGLFSAGVLAFVGSWGEFILALTLTRSAPEAQTIPAAILGLSQAFELQWAWVSAGIIVSLLPVVLLVVVFQRWVVAGLASGAVQG